MKRAALLIIGILMAISAYTASKKQPNVIFIFADDQRYNSLGITGDPVTQTPNIDQLAREGVLFDQAVITSPICGPSRANIFTGQWERKNNIGFCSYSKNVVSEEAFANSWLMQLKGAGYSTAFIGKHHTTIVDKGDTPLKENIDFCYYAKGHLNFHPADKHKVFSNLKNKTQIEGLYEVTEAYLKQDASHDYFFENIDASFKECVARRDEEKPFCAWINFNLPHASSIGSMGLREDDPEMYKSLYADRKGDIPLPEGFPLEVNLPDNVLTHDDLMKYYKVDNKEALLNKKMKMCRAVHGIDAYVGKLRQLLEEMGEAENTIIIYCSDNGLLLGEHGLGGKTILYDENVHVPMIVYSPFLKEKNRGVVNSNLVVGQDIPATILDMCGVEVPETYQSQSFLPLLEGKKVKWREDVFCENLFTDQGYPRQEGVRSKEWKYIRSFSKENDRMAYLPQGIKGEEPIYEELFNLIDDPKEQHNLASDVAYAEILEHYRLRCAELLSLYRK